jgi:hypothetical protein
MAFQIGVLYQVRYACAFCERGSLFLVDWLCFCLYISTMKPTAHTLQNPAPLGSLSVRGRNALRWVFFETMKRYGYSNTFGGEADSDIYAVLRLKGIDIESLSDVPNCGAVTVRELEQFFEAQDIKVAWSGSPHPQPQQTLP